MIFKLLLKKYYNFYKKILGFPIYSDMGSNILTIYFNSKKKKRFVLSTKQETGSRTITDANTNESMTPGMNTT